MNNKKFNPKLAIAPESYKLPITLLSIFASLLAGAISYLSGILSAPIGKSLGFNPSDLSFVALINIALILGNFCGALSISTTIKRFTARISILGSSVLALLTSILLGFTGLFIIHSSSIAATVIFTICVFFSGCAFGNLNNTAVFLMIGIYRKSKEDDKFVNITQGTFGIFVALFGFLSAVITQVIGTNSWYIIYFIIAGISVGLVLLALYFKTGETTKNLKIFMGGGSKSKKDVTQKPKKLIKLSAEQKLIAKQSKKVITLGVILAGLAMFFYLMIENTQTFWYGAYVSNQGLGLKESATSALSAYFIACFWTGITFGRLVFRTILPSLKDQEVLIGFSGVVLVGLILMALTHTMTGSTDAFIGVGVVSALVIGLGLSVLYPSTLNFGMKQSAKPNPLNQAIIADMGIIGAALANILFYAISAAAKSSLGAATANAIPLFYAPGIIFIFVGFICGVLYWRAKSKEGQLVTKAKGIHAENLKIDEKYRLLRSN